LARIEQLIDLVEQAALRRELAAEVATLKRRQQFGLVFERHIPETTLLLNAPIRVGSTVVKRRDPKDTPYRVLEIRDGELIVTRAAPREAARGKKATTEEPATESVARSDVLVQKAFGETIYPVLTPLGRVERGGDRPYHAVIEGENYHALELLGFAVAGQVDVIYLDPPYNTGARDWKYNNDYVDSSDTWRHSKWLSFMEKRLRLCRKLLRPDGVMVITIDHHEVHHLGMLVEQLFPDAQIQMVTICINPSGASADGLSRVDEYALFCFFGGSQPVKTFEDYLSEGEKSHARWWDGLLRGGSGWTRHSRKNLCYPIKIDAAGRIAGTGDRFEGDDESARPLRDGQYELAWPVRKDGSLGIWRVDAARLMQLHERGYVYASKRDEERGTWSLKYLLDGAVKAIDAGRLEVRGRGPHGEALIGPKAGSKVVAKTMWHRGRHTAGGVGGTQLVEALIGQRGAFPYPKSVYAVRDALDTAVGDRLDALIVDVFAGSGTTAHAAFLMNAQDGGRRRTILVSNNEVNEETVRRLDRKGWVRGDPEFERHGVYLSVTRPRVTAAVTGRRQDSTPVPGAYLDGREYSEGFEENVEFLRLDYLDRTEVELGKRFQELLPTLWLSAGSRGKRGGIDPTADFSVAVDGPYGFLFRPSGVEGLLAALEARPDVAHVFVLTDSEDAFAELAEQFPGALTMRMLPRDYLRSFSNGRESAG